MTPAMNSSAKPTQIQIVVLSGPSGSGKSTIVDRLVQDAPVKLIKVISATTRPKRVHESDGTDYYFLTQDDFDARRKNGEFLECEEVHGAGYWYGTLNSELHRANDEGGWAFLEIDVHGALRVMEQYPHAVTIFLGTASETEFERRLRQRGTESEAAIQKRLATAREELKLADHYRYQVVNDDLDRAINEISRILSEEEAKLHV